MKLEGTRQDVALLPVVRGRRNRRAAGTIGHGVHADLAGEEVTRVLREGRRLAGALIVQLRGVNALETKIDRSDPSRTIRIPRLLELVQSGPRRAA